MALTSIATQAGATEEEARNFKYFETELKTKLATLSVIATELQALSADKNLTGKAAVARASQLHGKLTAATSDITSALEQLVAIHQSEVSAQDAGSTANLARTLANADEKNQHPLTQWVNQGVNENAEQIIASLSWVTQEYPFQPGRINEQPDPYMPPQFKPTIGQALTHAVHQAVKADNVEVLSALWQKLKFTQAAEYSPFLLELYQGAGYYRETGSIETLMPKPNVFGLITTPDYLGCLSTDALSQLLITLAGHTSTVTKELTQFLQSLPHNRKDKLDYTAALQAAACNETRTDIRSKKNVEILLPFAPQNARNETYKTIATMQPRLAHVGMKESQACIDMADTLLAVTTKPLSCDLLVAIAKTGSATNLRHALVHLEAKELPDVLAKTVSTPSIASEENTQILLQHVETSHITVEPDKLSAALDFAVLKGYIKLLGAIVDMPAVHPLLNAKETKAAHANEGGNRILYKAAIYVGPGSLRSPREKRDDVAKALAMLKILHNEGRGAEIPVIHGARGVGILNIMTQRVTQDAPDLEHDDYFTLLRSRLSVKIAGDCAAAAETRRIEVQGNHGLLGGGNNPLKERREMFEQFMLEATALGLSGQKLTDHVQAGLESMMQPLPQRLSLGAGSSAHTSTLSTAVKDDPTIITVTEIMDPVREPTLVRTGGTTSPSPG